MENGLFLAKKILGGLLMPVPVTLLLLLWALLFLLRRKTRWLGFLCVLLATALLFAASYAPLNNRLIAPLEQRYPSYQATDEPAEYIAVLGSWHRSDPNQPVSSEVKPAGVVRLVEGIRIYHLNPGSRLIFTGYKGYPLEDPVAYPEKLKELALALGVPAEDILSFTGPKDTAEEARLIAENFPDSRLVLVTSAAHMPRSMQLFRSAGLAPVAAPTNHISRPVRSRLQYPSAHALANTQDWWHEQLGTSWSQLIGQIKEKTAEK